MLEGLCTATACCAVRPSCSTSLSEAVKTVHCLSRIMQPLPGQTCPPNILSQKALKEKDFFSNPPISADDGRRAAHRRHNLQDFRRLPAKEPQPVRMAQGFSGSRVGHFAGWIWETFLHGILQKALDFFRDLHIIELLERQFASQPS